MLALPLLCALASSAAPASLQLEYFGAAGWRLSNGVHTVLVDPYFSRPADPFHGSSDPQAVAAHAPGRVDLILVGHAHVDHALDAPALSKRTGAPLWGSAELVQQARRAGVADDKLQLIKGGEDYAFDGFSVRVIPSLHSVTGLANGDDTQTFAFLIRMAGKQILVFDTANFIERELEGIHPDVAIVAPGLREKVHDYSCRLMRLLGKPALVLATHFDDWKKPPQRTRVELPEFAAELKACSPATRLTVPTPFVPFSLP